MSVANDVAAVGRPTKSHSPVGVYVELLISDRNGRSTDCSVAAVALPLPFQGKTLRVIAPPSDGVIGFDPDRSRPLGRRDLVEVDLTVRFEEVRVGDLCRRNGRHGTGLGRAQSTGRATGGKERKSGV